MNVLAKINTSDYDIDPNFNEKPNMTKKTPLPDLENSLTEINSLIEQMEHSELSLEQSLAHFERGITLIKHSQKILQEAEQKVQLLMKKNNEEILTDYENTNE